MADRSGTIASPRLTRYFSDYARHHKTLGNQVCHYIGISCIVIGLLGLLGGAPIIAGGPDFIRLDAGTILIGLASLWYLYLDWKITIPFLLVIMGTYFLGRAIPSPANWALFVFGWICQGVGHIVYEKNSPAFFKNLVHLLIGPLWLFAKTIGYR